MMKVCIITGGNDGIGKATAKIMAKHQPISLVIACRNVEKAEEAIKEIKAHSNNDDVQCLKLDLGSLDAIKEFVQNYKQLNMGSIDYLINNAGVYFSDTVLTKDGFESMFGINHLGHFYLTNLLLPLLSSDARIVNVSSVAHKGASLKFDDKHFPPKANGFSGYGQSKLCNILFTNELQRQLDEKGSSIVANSMHPGTVHTNFLKGLKVVDKVFLPMFSKLITKVEDSGEAVFDLTIGEKPIYKDKKATYFDLTKPTKSNSFSQKAKNSRELWLKSAKLVGIPEDISLQSNNTNTTIDATPDTTTITTTISAN